MPNRSIRTQRRSMFRDTMALSGWLFADLLLGIAMLFLVFNTVGAEQDVPPSLTPTPIPTYTRYPTYTPYPPTGTMQPTHTIQPTYTPQATYTPDPTYTPFPTPGSFGIDTIPFTNGFQIVNASRFSTDTAERERVRLKLHEFFDPYVGKRRAGLVITTGWASAANPGFGNDLAEEVNKILFAEFPDMFRDVVHKAHHDLRLTQHPLGYIEIEAYFFYGGQ